MRRLCQPAAAGVENTNSSNQIQQQPKLATKKKRSYRRYVDSQMQACDAMGNDQGMDPSNQSQLQNQNISNDRSQYFGQQNDQPELFDINNRLKRLKFDNVLMNNHDSNNSNQNPQNSFQFGQTAAVQSPQLGTRPESFSIDGYDKMAAVKSPDAFDQFQAQDHTASSTPLQREQQISSPTSDYFQSNIQVSRAPFNFAPNSYQNSKPKTNQENCSHMNIQTPVRQQQECEEQDHNEMKPTCQQPTLEQLSAVYELQQAQDGVLLQTPYTKMNRQIRQAYEESKCKRKIIEQAKMQRGQVQQISNDNHFAPFDDQISQFQSTYQNSYEEINLKLKMAYLGE